MKYAKKILLPVAALSVMTLGIGTSAASSHELITDRCSGEVGFPTLFTANPTHAGTVVLKRGSNGYSPWTTFSQKIKSDGHVRWWCHSTTGNVFDPGTWRVKFDRKGATACLVSMSGAVTPNNLSACMKTIRIGTASFNGWTAEQSRCSDHSSKFRARLGPDRLLQTECLGK